MNLFNNKRNILIILGVTLLIIVVTSLSYTYAYFAFRETNSATIKGDAGIPKIELTVEKIIPTAQNDTLKLVPLLNNAIGNAVAGNGGKSSCIDANNNLSCQIYKVTVKNTGTINFIAQGTIELSAKGSNNIFENLKWIRLENQTTVKSGAVVNGMTKSILVENDRIDVNATKIYYFALWISEIDKDQSEDDYGDFTGIVSFLDDNGKGVTSMFGGYNSNIQ